jgi:hypothetical protein
MRFSDPETLCHSCLIGEIVWRSLIPRISINVAWSQDDSDYSPVILSVMYPFSVILNVAAFILSFIFVMYYCEQKSGTSNFCQFWKIQCSFSFIVILPLIIVIEIWHYSSWQFLFYTSIFLFQVPSSFDKGKFWLGLLNKYSLRAYLHSFPTTYNT